MSVREAIARRIAEQARIELEEPAAPPPDGPLGWLLWGGALATAYMARAVLLIMLLFAYNGLAVWHLGIYLGGLLLAFAAGVAAVLLTRRNGLADELLRSVMVTALLAAGGLAFFDLIEVVCLIW